MVTELEAQQYYQQLIMAGTSPEDAKREVAEFLSMMDEGAPTEISIQDSIAAPVAGAVTDRAIQSILGVGGAEVAAESALAGAGSIAEPALAGAGDIAGAAAPGYSAVPGVIGAALAADVLMNKRHGARGAGQGALAGAGIGWTFGGPTGALIGAPIGAGIGYFGNFGDENKFETEYNRAQDLRDKGINWDLNTQKPSQGRSKEELTSEAARNIAMGQYGNVEYAESRNMGDSRPEDWWGFSVWGEKFGNDWLKKYSEDQRRQIVQRGLELNLFDENTGSLDVNFTPEYEADIQKILSGEMTVETTPWEPGQTGQEGPARGTGPYPISINISGGGGSGDANADLTSQALIEMGLSNDDSVNLINSYKQLGALTPNEAAAAAYSVGKMKGPI